MSQQVGREWGADGEIDLFDGVLFVWRARYLILALLAIGTVAGYISARRLPVHYMTAADVLVTIPPALSSVVPDARDVDAMDRLSRSESTTGAVEAELRDEFLSKRQRIVAYRTIVDKSLAGSMRPSLSVLTLSVTATTPELARRAADAWARIVVREEARIAETTRQAAIEFFTEQYDDAAKDLLDRKRILVEAKRARGDDVPIEAAQFDVARASFMRAGKRLDEAKMLMQNRDAAVHQGSPAAPAKALEPDRVRPVVGGAVIGLVLALFVAWVRSRLHERAALNDPTPARAGRP